MAEEWECPFCKSTQLKYPTPYVELDKNGEYTAPFRYCCKAQEQNHKFVKRYEEGSRPDPEEVGKW